jgi:hypothetical protein
MINPVISANRFNTATPSFVLNFLSGVLDARVSVSRALNTATCVNSSGLIAVVNANLPRFDYDPITRSPRGMLIEETRINRALYSSDLSNVVWATVYGSFTLTGSQVDPSGGTTATILSGSGGFAQLITGLSANTTYVYSFYAKSISGVPSYRITSGGGTTLVARTSYAAQLNASTFTRISFSFTTGASDTSVRVYPLDIGSTTNVVLAFHQVEQGSFVTSYIPTGASTVTRNADVATITGTNFSDWWQPSKGSALVRVRPSVVSGTRPLIQFDDTTGNNIIALRGNTTNPELYVRTGGSDQAQIDAGTISANVSYRLAGAWATDSCAASVNSGTPVLDGVATIPVVTQARLGSDGTNYLNGHLEALEYYNERILNATLQVVSSTAGYQSIISPVILDAIIS